MPTITRTLQIAPIAQYLSSNKISKGKLFGSGSNDPNRPITIFMVYKIAKKVFDYDPTYSLLQKVCDYLYELIQPWSAQAGAIYDGGTSGGSVAPATGTQTFPIYITSAAFTTATFYPNTNIFGNNIVIFLSELNRLLEPGVEFSVDATGITIINTPSGNLDGFDATVNSYHLLIEKYNN
jgi:hypothetical protein